MILQGSIKFCLFSVARCGLLVICSAHRGRDAPGSEARANPDRFATVGVTRRLDDVVARAKGDGCVNALGISAGPRSGHDSSPAGSVDTVARLRPHAKPGLPACAATGVTGQSSV